MKYFLIILFSVIHFGIFAQNKALYFDGINDYVEVPKALEGLEPNDDYTLSFWLKVPTKLIDPLAAKPESLLSTGTEEAFPFQVTIARLGNTKKVVVTRSDGATSPSISTSARIDDSQWHHVAIVKLKKMLFLYVDGELDAFVKDNTDLKDFPIKSLFIGKGIKHFNGTLDELRLQSVAFSDTEVVEDMKKALIENDELVFAFDFNESIANSENNIFEPICESLVNDYKGFLRGFDQENFTSNWVNGTPVAMLQGESMSWFGELSNAIINMRNGDPVNLQLSWFLKGLAGICIFVFMVYLAINWEMNRRKRRALEKEKQLNKELGKKKNELLSQSLHLAKKNEVINDINTELKEISKGVNTSNEKLNTILKTLRFEQNAEQDWEVFKTQFNEVHKGFDVKLKAISPEVTNTDIKLVAFLRMKMTNKEIANILNVQPMSVKKSKFRLRKKLKMDPEEFESFLDGL